MSESTKRAEKLASAVYLVTSFFADQEPLKWRLRTLAADMITTLSRSVVLNLSSLFIVAKNAGLVSLMNHGIISKELYRFQGELGLPDGLSDMGGDTVLSPNFFQERARELSESMGGDKVIRDNIIP